ncbi:hypothetical protein ACEPAG_8419 [Sanghuangporus baumii]
MLRRFASLMLLQTRRHTEDLSEDLNEDLDDEDLDEKYYQLYVWITELSTLPSRPPLSLHSNGRCLFDSIPLEITVLIFQFADQGNPYFLVRMSAVDHCWREFVRCTPLLWISIRLGRNWYYRSRSKFLMWIQAHLDHSADLPLCVDLDFQYVRSHAESRSVMEVLDPQLSRCYSFRLSAPDWDWMVIVAGYLGNLRDCLVFLSLQIGIGQPYETDNPYETYPAPVLAGSFPNLRHLTLEHTPLISIFADAEVPRLREIHIIRNRQFPDEHHLPVSIPEFSLILTHHHELEIAHLAPVTFYEEVGQNLGRVLCERITAFKMFFVTQQDFKLFLQYFAFPSLALLEIEIDVFFLYNVLQRDSVTTSSFPMVRHLELILQGHLEEQQDHTILRNLFAHMNQIRTLAFRTANSDILIMDFFMALREDTGGWTLPRLQDLRISGFRGESSWQLLGLVSERAHSGEVDSIHALFIAPSSVPASAVICALKQEVTRFRILWPSG